MEGGRKGENWKEGGMEGREGRSKPRLLMPIVHACEGSSIPTRILHQKVSSNCRRFDYKAVIFLWPASLRQ